MRVQTSLPRFSSSEVCINLLLTKLLILGHFPRAYRFLHFFWPTLGSDVVQSFSSLLIEDTATSVYSACFDVNQNYTLLISKMPPLIQQISQ